MDTITHYIDNQISHFRGFNRYSKFILIGNIIDGYLSFGKEVLNSYAEVKEWLPQIITGIEGGGEWALELYQIPDDYKIRKLYGYYEVPLRGKKVFKLSYMNFGSLGRCFVGNSVIHFESQTIYQETNNYPTLPITTYRVYEENYSIHLHEDEKNLSFNLNDYPGNLEQIKKERQYQRRQYSSALEYALNKKSF